MSLTEYNIREAIERDFEAILFLQREFVIFQKTPDKMKMTLAQMKKDKQYFRCFVAVSPQSEIVGFVTFFPAYYSPAGLFMWMICMLRQHTGKRDWEKSC